MSASRNLWICLLFFLVIEIFSCPIWAGPRRVPHSVEYKVPEKPHNMEVEQQWPLEQWAEAAVGSGAERRVRRKDSELIPLDLEVFRRENTGPKPVWKDPQSRQAPNRKNEHSTDIDEE